MSGEDGNAARRLRWTAPWRWPLLAVVVALSLTVGSRYPWSGAASLAVVVLLVMVGAVLIPRSLLGGGDAGDDADIAALRVLLGCIGGGILLFFVLLTVSAYAGSVAVGSVLLVPIALAGAGRLWRHRAVLVGLRDSRLVVLTTFCAFALAMYLQGVNELVIGDEAVFSYRWDWSIHLRMEAMIREQGLPLAGSPDTASGLRPRLVHTGLPLLASGIEILTGTTPYHAGRTIGILSLCLIALGSLVLVHRHCPNRPIAAVAAMTPLLWGGLSLPLAVAAGSWDAVLDPYLNGVLRGLMSAGTLYHNLTQTVAVALSVLCLVLLDGYHRVRHLPAYALAVALLTVSGMVKPSTIIVSAPALLILLIVKRESPAVWGTTLSALGIGIACYFMPSWLYGTAIGGGSWVLRPTSIADPDLLLGRILMVGIGWLALGWIAIRFVRDIGMPRSWSWYDLQFVAFLGGILFYLLFRETGRESHGNHSWSMHGALIPLTGFIVAWTAKRISSWVDGLALRRVAGGCMTILLFVQLLGGTIYAVRYPTIGWWTVPMEAIRTVEKAQDLTPVGSRFLLPPDLFDPRLFPYLGRPWEKRPNLFDRDDIRRRLQKSEDKSRRVLRRRTDGFDAIIVPSELVELRELLGLERWVRTATLDRGGFELWMRGPP